MINKLIQSKKSCDNSPGVDKSKSSVNRVKFQTIKANLYNILIDPNKIADFNDVVLRSNYIIMHTYQFMRLWILYDYDTTDQKHLYCPNIDSKLIEIVFGLFIRKCSANTNTNTDPDTDTVTPRLDEDKLAKTIAIEDKNSEPINKPIEEIIIEPNTELIKESVIESIESIEPIKPIDTILNDDNIHVDNDNISVSDVNINIDIDVNINSDDKNVLDKNKNNLRKKKK